MKFGYHGTMAITSHLRWEGGHPQLFEGRGGQHRISVSDDFKTWGWPFQCKGDDAGHVHLRMRMANPHLRWVALPLIHGTIT